MKEKRNAKIHVLEIPNNASNAKRTFSKPHLKNKSHFSVSKQKFPNFSHQLEFIGLMHILFVHVQAFLDLMYHVCNCFLTNLYEYACLLGINCVEYTS